MNPVRISERGDAEDAENEESDAPRSLEFIVWALWRMALRESSDPTL